MNYNKKKGVNVTNATLHTLASIADNLSATAAAAMFVHLYFGDGNTTMDLLLYVSFSVLALVSVWLKSILDRRT